MTSSNSNFKRIYDCPVLYVENLVGDIHLMRLHCPNLAELVQPGQFINIKVNNDVIPLLRKPFSICRCNREEGWIEILWKIVGKGTEILSEYKTGDNANILGPLGKGFQYSPDIKTAALVGGGIGIAPLPFLCEELLKIGTAIEVFIGAKSASELVFISEFQEKGVEVLLATEDGSKGKRGFVTDALLERLKQNKSSKPECIFSCGPPGFLKCMAGISESFNIEGQLSIESMMACGFGICMGCPVKSKQDNSGNKIYKLTCIDGPVFDVREVIFDD